MHGLPTRASRLHLTWCAGAQVLPINKGDRIAAMLPVEKFQDTDCLLMATQQGSIKKTPLSQCQGVRASGLAAITLKVRLPPRLQSPADQGSCWQSTPYNQGWHCSMCEIHVSAASARRMLARLQVLCAWLRAA